MIEVKLFASLREQLGFEQCQLDAAQCPDVAAVWRGISKGMAAPSNLLCARNLEYCKLDTRVQAGDEVAFFPPVTGG